MNRTARQPFPPADDFPGAEEPIPLMTPFQRYILDGMRDLAAGQEELKKSVDALAPRIAELELARDWKTQALRVGKKVWPVILTLFVARFPDVASILAPLLDAVGKASP